ncbi:MAG: RNA polymerase sigma factor RpoD, partial [Rhodobacteraceae bacterium]|nr:RNA polymerase sigma factor RpoD [Paracoccaceae bacterium]
MAAKDIDDNKQEERDSEDTSFDMSQAAVKRMIAEARERGYITYDQLNSVMPPDQVSGDQIEDVMSMLSEMGINVIESEEAEEGESGGQVVPAGEGSREVAVATTTSETLDRTDDPVRMYLRE